MKFLKYISFVVLISFVFGACNSNTTNKEEHTEEAEHGHEHEEEAQTSVSLSEAQMKAVGVEIGNLEKRNMTNSIKLNGVLNVPNSSKAVVTAVFGGVITSMLIDEGDYVQKGQVIATLTNPEYINVQEQFLLVDNQIVYAEQEFERQQELFNNGAGAKKNLQSASTQLKDLKTQRASLVQRLQMMGISPNTITNKNMKNGLVIKSPINGTVSNLMAKVGSNVDISTPVAEVIDNASIHLDLNVFEKDIDKISLGQIIDFTLTNVPGKVYKAKVSSIGSSFENESKSIVVHGKIEGDKKGLIDGMSVVANLNLSNDLMIAVKNTAIVDADGKSYIFVKTDKKDDGHDHKEEKELFNFEKIEVVKGATDLGYTAIVPVVELTNDAVIVVKGAFFVNAKMSNLGEHEH